MLALLIMRHLISQYFVFCFSFEVILEESKDIFIIYHFVILYVFLNHSFLCFRSFLKHIFGRNNIVINGIYRCIQILYCK